MLADDFVGFIALDFFGSLIPGGDSTLGIEEENGVVYDTVNEKPKDVVACRVMNCGL